MPWNRAGPTTRHCLDRPLTFELTSFSFFFSLSYSHQGDLSELGKVLMQGSFSVWTGHRKGPTKMKDLARFKPMQRHLFLYEKALVFCKKREEHGDGYDKTSSYSFKHYLKVSTLWLGPLLCILETDNSADPASIFPLTRWLVFCC